MLLRICAGAGILWLAAAWETLDPHTISSAAGSEFLPIMVLPSFSGALGGADAGAWRGLSAGCSSCSDAGCLGVGGCRCNDARGLAPEADGKPALLTALPALRLRRGECIWPLSVAPAGCTASSAVMRAPLLATFASAARGLTASSGPGGLGMGSCAAGGDVAAGGLRLGFGTSPVGLRGSDLGTCTCCWCGGDSDGEGDAAAGRLAGGCQVSSSRTAAGAAVRAEEPGTCYAAHKHTVSR